MKLTNPGFRIGRGLKKYTPQINKNVFDIAICIVLFNPAKSKRLVMNYLYSINQYKLLNLPVFTIELLFGDEYSEISPNENVFIVRSKSYMFHKERLCRLLESKIPDKYEKLLFVDSDIIWDNKSDWYFKLSSKLDDFDIVHPFETIYCLDLTYTKTLMVKQSIIIADDKSNSSYGFAWGFNREWYRNVGMFEYNISGAGDNSSGYYFTGHVQRIKIPLLFNQYSYFEEKINNDPPKISYCEGIVIKHLYHGSYNNRQYFDRHFMIRNVTDKDIFDLITAF